MQRTNGKLCCALICFLMFFLGSNEMSNVNACLSRVRCTSLRYDAAAKSVEINSSRCGNQVEVISME